jgi:hypothetical protein
MPLSAAPKSLSVGAAAAVHALNEKARSVPFSEF